MSKKKRACHSGDHTAWHTLFSVSQIFSGVCRDILQQPYDLQTLAEASYSSLTIFSSG